LDDKQLLAYLDGEADEATRSHLKGCAFCLEKAQALDRVQIRLKDRLYRLTCPSPIELGEYHLRVLPASQMLLIGQHLRECPHCTQEVSQLEGFLSDQSLSPNESLLGRAKILIARLIGEGTGQSGLSPAYSTLRGDRKGPITLAAEGIMLVLDIQPATEGRVNILGQVVVDNQDDWTAAFVELRKEDQLGSSSTVDDLGAFECEGILPGQQELRITPKNGSVVVIANFEIVV
jgi:hypothetical protein